MALGTAVGLKREADLTGNDIKLYPDSGGTQHVQAVVLVDNDGNARIDPVVASITSTVTVSGTVAATRPEDSITHDDPNTTLVDERTIKGSAATLYSLVVNNTDTQGLYAQVWDHASAAGSGTLRWSFYVPASSSLAYDFKTPLVCSTGLTVAVSTVTTGYTAPATTAAQFSADYD